MSWCPAYSLYAASLECSVSLLIKNASCHIVSTTGNEKYFPERSIKIDGFLMLSLRPNLKVGVKSGNKICCDI